MSTALTNGPSVGRVAVWFGALGGAIAWLAHLLLAYFISEFGCFSGLHGRTLGGLTAVAWAVLAVSAAMLLIAVAAAWVAYRSDRKIRGHGFRTNTPEGAAGFLARSGAATSGLFALIIIAQSIPIFFFLKDC